MSEARLTAPSVDDVDRPDGNKDGNHPRHGAQSPLIAAPAVFVLVLLLLATVFHGAFYLRDWGPPAVLVLGTLVALQLGGGGLPLSSRWVMAMLTGIWGFAGWTLLSATWSASPSSAWDGAAHGIFYAALVTIPIVLVPRQRVLELLGLGLIVGIALIAVIILIRMLAGDNAMFLAGRLDDPVGYRNATALLFALGFWPLIALAARGPARALRAGAFALAVLCLSLSFLTQSRGILLGLAAGALVALVLGPERVRRTWLAVLAAGLLLVFSHGLLTPYDGFDGGQGIATSHDIAVAARTTLVLVIVAFLVGLALALVDNGLRTGTPGMQGARAAARGGLVVIVVLGVAGAYVAVPHPVAELRSKWKEFTANETIATGQTRYANVSGQRADLWRVALYQFRDAPIIGRGQGSYPSDYYQNRRNDRNLDDPHGLPFQVLGELGLVGALMFLVFLVGTAGAIRSGWASVPRPRQRLAGGLAASGAVLIGQSMVDWMWRIPGVTGLGLLSMSIGVALVLPVALVAPRRLSIGWRALTGAGLTAALLIVGVLYLSDFYVRQARARSEGAPAAGLSSARHARQLDPLSVVPWYLMASAHESEGDLVAARADLAKALQLEPASFATMGVIGDFYARQGRYALARHWYGLALLRNPVDVGLQQLARTGGRPTVTPAADGD